MEARQLLVWLFIPRPKPRSATMHVRLLQRIHGGGVWSRKRHVDNSNAGRMESGVQGCHGELGDVRNEMMRRCVSEMCKRVLLNISRTASVCDGSDVIGIAKVWWPGSRGAVRVGSMTI